MESGEKRVPVVILTGFLGAGKTTLLNRILTTDHGRRVAVIINEFGEVGIDHHLLFSSDQEIVQMSNGCLCCAVRGDLVRALFQLLEQRASFDTLLVETSGLADPAPVIQTFFVDERIRAEFVLHMVVTVVDAKHMSQEIHRSPEAREQIAFADMILLNKTDLATPEELDSLEGGVRTLNRTATILRSRNAEVDIRALLNTKLLNWEERLSIVPDLLSGDHSHTRDISTVSIVEPGDLDGLKLSTWFRSVLNELGPNLLRMKGILNLKGDPHQFVFHGVHVMFEGRPGREWDQDEARLNRLVFIGRDLDGTKIKEGFRGCLASEDGGSPVTVGSQDSISPFTIDQIQCWTRQSLSFPPDTPILVKEVPCVKPGCPPIETAVMVFLKGEPPRLYKIQKGINKIAFDDVYNLIENPMPCC